MRKRRSERQRREEIIKRVENKASSATEEGKERQRGRRGLIREGIGTL